MAIRIQLRRDTAANWATANPVLLAGEMGIETDTLKIKIGNGNNWNSISQYANTVPSDLVNTLGDYVLVADMGQPSGVATLDSAGKIPMAQLGNIIDSAPGVLDTLNEIAAAINDDANFATTITTLINNTGTTAANDATTKANEAVSTAAAYTDGEIDTLHTTLTGEISTHNSDTTSVHGITDTAALATKTYADNAVSVHELDTTNIHGIADTSALATKTYADTAIGTHSSHTTSIHGIADTAELATKTYADNAATAVENQLSDYVLKVGSIMTGPLTVHTLYATDADVSGTFTANNLVIDGDLTVNGTSTTINTTDLAIKDNLIYLNEAMEATVTNAVGDGSNVVYTVDNSNSAFVAGSAVRVVGITPSGLNCSWLEIQSATATSFTVNKTDTDTYISGGTAYTKADINPDLGFVGGYNDGTYAHAGLVRDASDGVWKLFTGVTTEPTGVIDFTTYTRASLQVGALFATGAAIGDVSNAEIQRVHGVTSPIQTQIDDANTAIDLKSPKADPSFTGNAKFSGEIRISSTGSYVFSDGAAATPSSGSVALSRKSDGSGLKYNAAGTDYNIASEYYVSSAIIAFDPVPSQTPISQKTSDYTLSSVSEKDTMIEFNSSSDLTITIPPASSVNYPNGTTIDIMNVGTGLVTVVAGSGVTVNATPGLKLRTTWSSATLLKRDSNNWVVYGDLKA